MSIDRTLKSSSALTRHRNVLTRAERIEKLADDGLWSEEDNSVFGLPKVANRKASVGKKIKKEKVATEGEEAVTEGEQTSEKES
ncbi:MAG: small basic protein [Sedimentisphaerales bacterium]|nr:small basic protein [Sedimentisphaerales bacterium]